MEKSSPVLLRRFISCCFIFSCCLFFTMKATDYNIIPYPQQLIPLSGAFTFNSRTVVVCDTRQPEVLKLAQQFAHQMKIVTGMKLLVKNNENADSTNAVIFQAITAVNSEAYNLFVSPKTIRIQAQAPNGFFYGLQTLYQLLPVEIYGKQKGKTFNWSAAAVAIADAPRFGYRGLHLDVCRHFFPLAFIKKYIDAMAIHKLNSFHWHLTDDQGWRIEIKKYPRLTEVGSKRDETLVGYYFERFPQQFDGKPYGGFYTQAEAREIVAYAAERFITVIPEIELPGHAQAALASYPYLSCTPDSILKVATKWGIFKDIFCPRDTTFKFLEDVLTEIMDIFPGKYIHIGGDECPKDNWKACADCQALIKKLNLKDEHALQSYFIKRIETFLNSKGRRIIGWDEILDGGLAPNATVMSWRGTAGGIAAAKAGHDVIMTPNPYCYLDAYQGDPVNEPTTIGGYLPLSKVYQYEPIPMELAANEQKYIWGVQGNLWSEYMPTSERVEYMAFPRVAAIAEVAWSSKKNRNWDSFRNRMPTQFKRYEQLNIGAGRNFFDVQYESAFTSGKQLQITLTCDHPEAQIRCSINGKEAVYTNPFILPQTADIAVRAYLKGKPVGKSITKSYMISKLTGLDYTKNVNHTWYNGGNVNALTDGITGNTKVYTQWLAISGGVDGEIAVDLQQVQSIGRFSVGLLSAPALCVQLTPEIKLFGSVDGVTFQLLASKELPAATAPTWEMFRPELTFAPTKVRFLKLVLKNAGMCPADRPHGGVGSMLFMDEMGAWQE